VKTKNPWIMDQKTLEQRGIRIPNDRRIFFIPIKQNYLKQVERIKMWKKMEREKRLGLVRHA
jgi:hypothetical protein